MAMKIEFVGNIADSASALRRSGKLSGGGNVTFDVPEDYIGALAAMMPLVLTPVKVTIEVADEALVQARPAPRRGRRIEETTSPSAQAPPPPSPPSSQPEDAQIQENARKVLDAFRQQHGGDKPPKRPEF